MKNNLLPISKDGFSYVGYSLAALVVFTILDVESLAAISFVALAFFLFLYRNPERENPYFGEASLVSPVDGKVIKIEEVDDDANGFKYKVEVESDYLSTTILRVPLTSSVKESVLSRGSRVSKSSSLFGKINENASIVFEDDKANKVKVIHTLKQSVCGINVELNPKQKLYQGKRYGTLVNGVTVIYLPQNFRVNVKEGDEVKASTSLFGYFS